MFQGERRRRRVVRVCDSLPRQFAVDRVANESLSVGHTYVPVVVRADHGEPGRQDFRGEENGKIRRMMCSGFRPGGDCTELVRVRPSRRHCSRFATIYIRRRIYTILRAAVLYIRAIIYKDRFLKLSQEVITCSVRQTVEGNRLENIS